MLNFTANLQQPTARMIVPALPTAGSTPMQLSIVLPTYNEAANIAHAVAELALVLRERLPGAFEIIVVDDDSPDGTWRLAEALSIDYPELRVLRRTRERGLATAVIRGWQVARGLTLGVMDADLQHPAEVNIRLYDEIERGAELAVATRYVAGGGVSDWKLLRRAGSRLAQVLGLLILPLVVGRVSDPMSGFFLVRRSAISEVPFNPVGYKVLIEVLARARCRWIAEAPYVFRERTDGASKVTRQVYYDYLRHLATLRLESGSLVRFARFGVVGLSGVAVDMTVLYLLSDPTTLHWGLTRSKLIAAQTAIVNNFFWNDRWTFRDKSRPQPGAAAALRRFAKFEAICLAGVVLNVALINVLFNRFGVDRYLANAIAIAAVTGWNYTLNLLLNWRSSVPR